jgi:serine/threonine-protein kinase
MLCRRCGAAHAAEARFCQACGAPLEATPAAAGRRAVEVDPSSITQAAPSVTRPSRSSGWLSASDSISHGRFAPGTVIDGRYRIIGLLGRGGMGEVFRADDLRLGQPVALKFLPDSVRHDPERLAQFHNEVRVARQVSHPNICRVYDIGETGGHLFLSMELVDGEDLATSLRRIGRFPEDKATQIARQLCAGLAAAHARGILHRDLKPGNVMLDGAGTVRLMDFGLAAVGTVSDIRVGTPAYMAPEQLEGREVTSRSDIYALGLVLYELFTGRRAFAADTIAEIMERQRSGPPTAPRAIVPAIDAAVEEVILQCLQPDPARRPASPLAVSAALPGGDPLAAALAAGETPSPEMVAAAGEGAGLGLRTAVGALIAIVAGLAVSYALALRASPLDALRPELTAEVLAQKARDALRQLGYAQRAGDEAYGLEWAGPIIDHHRLQEGVRWGDVLARRPSPLLFWYRRADAPMTAAEFHTDLLTPGIVTPSDPAPLAGGMITVRLDHEGRLAYLEAIPPQRAPDGAARAPVDWDPVLRLAGLDPASLQPADPQWRWLAASDTAAAWTGTWPGSPVALRVEAAALEGRPVAFMTMGPWTQPWRTTTASSGREVAFVVLIFLVAVAILAGGLLLARRNLREGRGDRAGARAVAIAVAAALLALWACRVHLAPSTGILGTFLLVICTSVFYGVLFWALYLALEPFVRRHWPQTLVSWTTLLGGRVRDRVVGRDVLVGVALGVGISLLLRGTEPLAGNAIIWPSIDLMLGMRSTAGEILTRALYAARTGLLMVFVLVMLRVATRSQWAAAAGFVLLFTALNALDSDRPAVDTIRTAIYFSMFAAAVLRWGLTTLTVGVFVADLMLILPATTDVSAWYIGQTALLLAIPLGLAGWAFHTAVAGRTGRRALP